MSSLFTHYSIIMIAIIFHVMKMSKKEVCVVSLEETSNIFRGGIWQIPPLDKIFFFVPCFLLCIVAWLTNE